MSNVQPPISLPTSNEEIADFFDLSLELDNSFLAVVKYLVDYHHAKTAVIEERYIDRDWSNEFSNFYSKTFQYRHGFCTRIHFFQDELSDLEEVQRFWETKESGYLGYIVRRPVEVGKVGRSLIMPYQFRDFFYLCCIEREVHLFGRTRTIRGIPYIQQDAMVMSCAQSTIWMATNYMHHAHKLSRIYPHDITFSSTEMFSYLGRPIPSNGLTVDQMVHGLNHLGLSPVFYTKPQKTDYPNEDEFEAANSEWNPISYIYPYIESEFPVIISFADHTCLLVGHTIYDDFAKDSLPNYLDKIIKFEEVYKNHRPDYHRPSLISSDVFCNAFIMNDDQRGPYRILPSNKEFTNYLLENYRELLPKNHFDRSSGREVPDYEDIFDIDEIIIPLPDKVYLIAEDVVTNLFLSLPEEFVYLEYSENLLAKELFASQSNRSDNPLVYRLHCISSAIFKEAVLSNTFISEIVKEYYRRMPMPRLIWVAEISTYTIYMHDKKIIGEFIYDATANKRDRDHCLLSVHLPSYFRVSRNLSEVAGFDPDNFPATDIPFEEPYDHYTCISEVRRPCRLEKKNHIAEVERDSNTKGQAEK